MLLLKRAFVLETTNPPPNADGERLPPPTTRGASRGSVLRALFFSLNLFRLPLTGRVWRGLAVPRFVDGRVLSAAGFARGSLLHARRGEGGFAHLQGQRAFLCRLRWFSLDFSGKKVAGPLRRPLLFSASPLPAGDGGLFARPCLGQEFRRCVLCLRSRRAFSVETRGRACRVGEGNSSWPCAGLWCFKENYFRFA